MRRKSVSMTEAVINVAVWMILYEVSHRWLHWSQFESVMFAYVAMIWLKVSAHER